MLQAFVLQRPLFYLLHPIDIVVAPADDADDGLAFEDVSIVFEGGDAKGAGGFYDHGVFVVQLEDGAADAAFGYGPHFVQYFPADAVGEIADASDGCTVDKGLDVVEGYGMPGFKGGKHGGSSFGFEADDLRAG